jgi:hypothetical protein
MASDRILPLSRFYMELTEEEGQVFWVRHARHVHGSVQAFASKFHSSLPKHRSPRGALSSPAMSSSANTRPTCYTSIGVMWSLTKATVYATPMQTSRFCASRFEVCLIVIFMPEKCKTHPQCMVNRERI